MKQPLIVYIIGDVRSGSTLLDYLLSCHPDAFSVGELFHLHSYYKQDRGMGVLYDWKCSCGETIEECAFWSKVLRNVDFSDSYETRFRNRLISPKEKVVNFIKTTSGGRISLYKEKDERRRKIAQRIWALYEEIYKQSGKPIIIDSSKNGLGAYYLNRYAKGNIKFLFLERKIQGVAYSKYRRRKNIPKKVREYWNPKKRSIYGYLYSSSKRLRANRGFVKKIKNQSGADSVYTLEYSDLARNTGDEIAKICAFLNIDDFKPPTKTNDNPEISHSLCGSPSRQEKRDIKYDERWKSFFEDKPLADILGKLLP